MQALLPTVLATSYLVLAADRMPQFDADAVCRASAATETAVNRTEDSCKRDEASARSKLEQDWGQYNAAQHAQCVSLSRLGGRPSYVETLTCLEMAKAADSLPEEDRSTGQGGK